MNKQIKAFYKIYLTFEVTFCWIGLVQQGRNKEISFLIFTTFTPFFIVLWVFSRKSLGVRETGCMNELLNISCLLNYKTRIIKIALSHGFEGTKWINIWKHLSKSLRCSGLKHAHFLPSICYWCFQSKYNITPTANVNYLAVPSRHSIYIGCLIKSTVDFVFFFFFSFCQ